MKGLKRILFAEDDPKDVELTLAALAGHNLANEVVVTRDGEETLDYLLGKSEAGRANGHPAVLLLDIKMPKIDGIEVLRRMKQSPELRMVPVVVLTSSREDKDLKECYKLGANAYVVKPVKFPDFVEAVKQLGVFWALINEPPPGTGQRP